MADAACGPSNPLQQFRKQTQVDRTLQQDRLSHRGSPSQSFRTPNPHEGLLDPEFEAFQAGITAPEPLSQGYVPFGSHGFAAPGPSAPVTNSWTSDFQRMQISPLPPSQLQFAPGPSTADWTQGFKQHLGQQAPRQASSSPFQYQQQARYGGLSGYQSQFAPQQPTYGQEATQGKGKQAAFEPFDDAAFEAAFDQAAKDIYDNVEKQTEAHALQDAIMREQEEAAATMDMIDERQMHDLEDRYNLPLEQPEQVQQPERTAEERQRDDDDALAATARDLLGRVEHNQTDKFKNSQFLGLMRRLADREVKVEGDKMVETGTSTNVGLFTATKHYPPAQTPDSTYASGPATPEPPIVAAIEQRPFHRRYSATGVCAMCKGYDCDVFEHNLDHWESPYS